MRCLSLWQVWASAMAKQMPNGNPVKAIETRHWPIKASCPFDLAIHAAKLKFVPSQWHEQFVAYCRQYRLLDDIVYGAVLCIVRVIAVKKVDDLWATLTPLERAFGNYVNNDDHGTFQQRYGFVTDPKHLRVLKQPQYVRGMQGVFNWEPPVGIEFK